MPKFNQTDTELEQHKLPTSNYGYSAARIGNLTATEYTLCTVIVDISGSTGGFSKQMESCIQEIVKACRLSPRADNLMLRVVLFGTSISELHGFKLLQDCNPGDYAGCCVCGGGTALFDSAENGIQATKQYAKQLTANDFTVNSLIVVITDGDDNSSTYTKNQVWDALGDCVQSESMESLVSILVGVNVKDPSLSRYLESFAKDLTDPVAPIDKFSQYVEIDNADDKTLAKLAQFVSKSISSQSQHLGTGGASQSLTF